ncbi:hypothetical protein HDU86_005928 [Geranomyces michiganensis]|nr:hypothetical protein HDU86_005928 [Geranomyces michiganensis]
MRLLSIIFLASAVSAADLYGRQVVVNGTDSASPAAPPAATPASIAPAPSSASPIPPTTSAIPSSPAPVPATTAVVSTQIVLTTINNVVRTVTRVIEPARPSSAGAVIIIETAPVAGSAAQLGGAANPSSSDGSSGGISPFEISVVVLGIVLGCVVASGIALCMIRRGREERKKKHIPTPSPRGPAIDANEPVVAAATAPTLAPPTIEHDEATSTATAAPPAYDFAYTSAGSSVPPVGSSAADVHESAMYASVSRAEATTLDERLWIAREGCKAERPGQITCEAGDSLCERHADGFAEVLNATTNESGLVPDYILKRRKN